MAGSVTESHQNHRTIRKMSLSWTSDASGDVSGTASSEISGQVLRIVTNPGATAPTALYDIVLNDEDGVDVAGAALADRHATNSEQVIPDPPIAVDGTLTPVVSNAGNAKQGAIVIYYR